MFKLVVLSALVAIAVAKPSGWDHGLELAPIVTNSYYSPAAYDYATPAVSYGVPVVRKAIVAAPVTYYDAHDSHSYRSSIVRRPFYARTLVAPTTYRYAPATYKYAPTTYRYAPTTYRYAPTTYRYAPTKYSYAPTTYRYAPATYRYAPTTYRYAPTTYRYAPTTYRYSPTTYKYAPTTYRYAQYAHTPTYAAHSSVEYHGLYARQLLGHTHTPSLYAGHTSSHYAPSAAYSW